MTLLQDAPAAVVPAGPRPPRPRHLLATLTLADLAPLPAGLWWALPLTHAVGGRNLGREVVLAGLLLVAGAIGRPWLVLPRLAVALPLAVSAAALLVCVTAPTGWRGADDAMGYVCASFAFVVAAGWAARRARRMVLAAAMTLAGLDQLSHALLPWWGGRDPSVLLSGTFYWHNPFAAFLLPPALLSVAFVTWRSRPWHLLGWVTAPLCAAGIVLSSSRATLALLVAGWVGIGLIGARMADRRRLLRRFAALTALGAGVTLVLPGPPLFPHWSSPLAATAARAGGGETLAANGGYRLQFWRSALETFVHHPWVGSGYHGLIASSRAYTPGGWARSNYAHNGYLQALSDGGLLLGLPIVLATSALLVLAVRTLIRAVRRATGDPLVPVSALVLLACLAHSGVDFDWSHSALFTMDALAAALLVGGACRPSEGARISGVAPVWLLLGLTAVVVGAVADHSNVPVPRTGAPGDYAVRLAAATHRPLASDAFGRDLVVLATTDPDAVPPDLERRAVAVTAAAARIDLDLAAERAVLLQRLGRTAEAGAVLVRVTRAELTRPAYGVSLAPLLVAVGRRGDAIALLRPLVADSLRHPGAGTLPLAEAWRGIHSPGDGAAACIVELAGGTPAGGTGCTTLVAAALRPGGTS